MKNKSQFKSGDWVRIYDERTDEWLDGKVVDLLSVQFTVKAKKKIWFRFYNDEGLTWERGS